MEKIKCGSQLYTFRKVATSEDKLPAIFAELKAYGCSCIQISGICGCEPKRMRRLADDYGLEIPLTHSQYDRIVDDTDRLAEEHLILGANAVGLGMMPSRFLKGEDGLKRFMEVANVAADKLEKYGLKFAYHNHFMEFKKIKGRTKLDIMIEEVPKMEFIFDTYWCKFAGYDPVEYMKKLKGRATTIHLKDYKKRLLIPRICDVGAGNLDWEAILTVAENGGTKYGVIEHDFTPNPYSTTKNSMDFLRKVYLEKQ